KRFTAKTVLSGLVTACRLAGCPIKRSPSLVKATIDGVVRAPSAFSMTLGLPPSMTATQLLVVPRSIPITLAIGYPTSLLRISDAARLTFRPRQGRSAARSRGGYRWASAWHKSGRGLRPLAHRRGGRGHDEAHPHRLGTGCHGGLRDRLQRSSRADRTTPRARRARGHCRYKWPDDASRRVR